jgi:hypothetical protein
MIPWQKVVTKALFEHDAIGMRATVVGPRTVWWQQRGSCVYVPVLAGGAARGLNHLLLVRSDAPGEHDPLLDAAICGHQHQTKVLNSTSMLLIRQLKTSR